MASDNYQLVTFQLGSEIYGVNIMMVNSIVRAEDIRDIPNSPHFVEGIYNLRGEIIPVINLHNRFDIPFLEQSDDDEELVNGMMIIQIGADKVGMIIDSVSRVVTIEADKIQPPPMTVSGIGREYITGIYNRENSFLIILNIDKIFDPAELRQLKKIGG